ncbi:oxysterol-binding protein-related protein 9 isoform X2 [Neocloeon triangulifer]|uniref:oxysterol-binding protein-related protein 9 isoform X2 n=1 Tax=Neocloeon triangulifer TaxID=2078957 RepID=UPI00286ECE72|nr:oxysterol-binding protein-related protein 9 isoform X2 [Neocloeon triangulifer]
MAAMEGYLSKWTNVMKGWQYRWFILDDNAGLMSYYTSREKMVRGVRRGCVRLKGAVIGIDDEDDSTFTVTVDGKTFHFQARDADERETWVRALEDTILRHAQAAHRRWDPSKPAPTVKDFDKKLTEADAYLQIVIDQVKRLDSYISKTVDEESRVRCENIKLHAEDMLENVKHTIALLQIAKSTAHPVNGIYQGPVTPMPHIDDMQRQVRRVSADFLNDPIVIPPLDPVQTGIELGAECMDPSLNTSSLVASALPNMGVPETSYSSSDEEDFFDANDYSLSSSHPVSPTGAPLHLSRRESQARDAASSAAAASGSGVAVASEGGSRAPPLYKSDGSLDYDALYEDDEEHDLVNMESNGSVVSHLISQVKIGMDLTKVALPTFILERRSLLEMYADYFAHPDIFVSIADFTDPRDRMVQVVRWYMSSYHAGRKSSVAKKPYNPVLGEMFKCWWDVPGITGHSKSATAKEEVKDGPVPWCHQDQLVFLAEQVSHHPPISAFYAEHYEKRISFCAHVWTKSKFLGLSIGVHNIGQGCVSVLDYDEEYIVTFPNGYGRSILTVPWIELGGTVTVTCNKTGYNANIEFLTKPFYGGKKNRVTAEVFAPSEKKPFLTVQGEWNGAMEAKWADGRTELFVDVNKVPIIKKCVKPISEQESNESRTVWKEVTAGLRLNDLDRAHEAKTSIEQRQRDLVLQRKSVNAAWENKVFHEAGENWVYISPLSYRLKASSANTKRKN